MSAMSQMMEMMALGAGGLDPTAIRGIQAFYALNETSGSTAYDTSGNGRDATFDGPNVTHGNASILPSGTGKSTIIGTDTGIRLPTGFMLGLARPFTIFGWGKPSDTSVGNQILASAYGGINFYIYTGNIYAGIAGVSNNLMDSRAVANNVTKFFALTVGASGNGYVYIGSTASSVFTGAFSSSDKFTERPNFGNYAGDTTNNFFTGPMQNLGFCNVDLSGAEIAAIIAAS